MGKKIFAVLLVLIVGFTLISCDNIIDDVATSNIVDARLNDDNELIFELSDGTLINVGDITGQTGEQGIPGVVGIGIKLIFINDEKKLIVTLTDDTTFDLGVVVGKDGFDGREVEFNVSDTHIEWRYVGEDTWTDLVSLDLLKGAAGEAGSNGTDGTDGKEIIIDVVDNNIVFKYEGEDTWTNLVDLEDLKGKDGLDGKNGLDGISVVDVTINSDGHLILTLSNGDPIDAGLVVGKDGTDGLSAYQIYLKHNVNYNKTEAEWLTDLVRGKLSDSDTLDVLTYEQLLLAIESGETKIQLQNNIFAPETVKFTSLVNINFNGYTLNGNLINELFKDIQVEGNGFVNSSTYKGVFVEISLPGTANEQIASLTVELFNANNELIGTNTLNSVDSIGSTLTSPFVVIPGTYESKSWETTWVGEASIDNAPAYAVITAVANNGISYSAEAEYTGDWASIWVPDIQVAGNGFVNSSTYKGVFVEILLPGEDNAQIQSLKVELFNGDELIGTNTLKSMDSIGSTLTSPFVVIPGTYTSGSWTTTWENDGASIDTAPDYAVITAVDNNGLSYFAEADYTGDWESVWPVAMIGTTTYSSLKDALDAVTDGDTIIELFKDARLEYGARDAYGNESTQKVTIKGNGKELTLHQTDSDWSSIGLTGADAIFALEDVNVVKTTVGGNGAWNNHAINFSSKIELTDTTFSNAINLSADAKLTGVTITEDREYYGIWIGANGQTVTIEDTTVTANTNGGRGIKISDQYIGTPQLVNLSVSNSTFNTAKKSAIIVGSEAGAKITIDNFKY